MYLIKEDSTGFFQSNNALLDNVRVHFTEAKAIDESMFVGRDSCDCCGEEIIHFAVNNDTILTIDSNEVLKPKLAA